jgi:3-deoxy-manno-octulosonate cytidylyltransferase (CMP-KDO synthetase)
MKTVIVIPARYGSTRLPGKPLLRMTGKYLIQHVYEQACRARGVSKVIVATDDSRIETAIRSFGGEVRMTGRNHPSGTDRVAEVARGLDADVVVNLQGDEPLIRPGSLEHVAELASRPGVDLATLAIPITSAQQWRNPNCVKVVLDDAGRALYFSRSPIPYVRDGEPNFHEQAAFHQHLGIYAYRRDFLLELAGTPPCRLEQLEKLEQLRVLAMGRHIQVGVEREAGLGVDTYEDYLQFVEIWRTQKRRSAA